MQNHSSDVSASPGVGRRAVMRTGVWAVPVVAVAVAAPAMAAHSAGTSKLSFNTAGVDVLDDGQGHKNGLHFRVQVQNDFVNGGPAVDPVQLWVSIPDTRVSGPAPSNVAGGGWAAAGVSHEGGQYVYAFVHAGKVAGGGNTGQLTFDVPLSDTSSGGFDVTFVATANGVASANRPVSVSL